MDFTILPIIFIIGFLTKFADLISDDGLKVIKPLDYITGILYGVLIAYVIYAYPLYTQLALAVTVAVIVMGKIDSMPHNLGIAALIVSIAYFGIPAIDITLLALFLLAGISDEIANDIADKKKKKGLREKIFEKRLILEVTVFAVSFITGQWMLFIGMLTFDIGYHGTTKIGEKLIKAR
ncbi:MAG: hypothetical protein KAS04_04850 [Candidatus Aenigmarchaeota archaeon]|nr:hypothetical protein [Candidatus Aenigmarchaeota archaeon]